MCVFNPNLFCCLKQNNSKQDFEKYMNAIIVNYNFCLFIAIIFKETVLVTESTALAKHFQFALKNSLFSSISVIKIL